MITTAFLTKVILYGIILAVIIPAIDLVLFVVRESRGRGTGTMRGTTDLWTQQESSRMPANPRPNQKSPSGPARSGVRDVAVLPAGAVREDRCLPFYVASNGVTITPAVHGRHDAVGAVETSGHPHAEYWTYGDARFYEGA